MKRPASGTARKPAAKQLEAGQYPEQEEEQEQREEQEQQDSIDGASLEGEEERRGGRRGASRGARIRGGTGD